MHISRITTLLLAGLAPLALGAQAAGNDDLKCQVEALKKQVAALEEKAKDQDKVLTKVETKVAQDNIAWGGDLRTRFDSNKWTIKPYQQFMGFGPIPSGPMAGMPMPLAAQMPGEDLSNSVQWSTRLRLRMTIPINENAKIMGRLSMYKNHGGGDVPIFNGSPNTVSNSFASVQTPSNDLLHVERASLVYNFPKVGVLSIGRQNTSEGPPMEVRDGSERQATPMAIMVNAEVDGIGWKFHLDKVGLPENTLLGFCYGVGYESGFGGGGQVKNSSTVVGTNFSTGKPVLGNIQGLKDTTVLGVMFDMPLLFEAFGTVHATNLYLGYNRFGNMVDIPYGSTINFPNPQGSSSVQYVTATNNLGDMDQLGLTWKHKVGDTFTYFLSAARIKSLPNGKSSQYGAYWDMPPAYGGNNTQLMGFGGLLGDPNHSKTGTCTYLGMRYDPVSSFGMGLEFNHGSPNWYTYTPAAGEPSEKLGARGDVWEAYLVWGFAKNASLKVGYIDYAFTHAYSGWHIGPAPIETMKLDQNPMLQYASPSSVKNTYVSLEVRF
jgi:hypothetical protein